MRPTEFSLDLSKFERRESTDVVGEEHYHIPKDGVTIELYRGFVQTLFLYPLQSEQKMKCKPPKTR
jgi:hypothetical protein